MTNQAGKPSFLKVRPLLKTLLLLELAICLGSTEYGLAQPGETSATDAREILDRLKGLEGTWRGEGGTVGGESNPVVHEFHVAAGNSIVMEIMDPDGEREINIYHLDGNDLLLTHYCGGGNQPTLKLDPGTENRDTLSFTFSRATNLRNPSKDRHIHASKLVFLGPNQIESHWVIFKNGKEFALSKFILHRYEKP